MDKSLQSSKLVLLLAIALVLFLNTEMSFLTATGALDNDSKVYIVYLGEREHDDPELVTASHRQMLESLLQSKEEAHNSMIYSYQHGFSGFAALLTSSQAKKISEHPSVIHVIPNRILKLKTTRTWEHLGLSPIPTSFSSSSSVKGLLHDTNMGSEAIIGVIDSGIWPESKALNDEGFGPIPKRWRGKCESGEQFNATIHCNKKLIGAKYYLDGIVAAIGGKFNKTIIPDFQSTRDANGHGTHTATTAGGSFVTNASFYGLAQGTARGGAPRARIASYKACWNVMGKGGRTHGKCATADMMKAYDDAIHDGVDFLSVSSGSGIPQRSEVYTPNYVAAFHAVAKGITVVASAGNAGPGAQTVANVAPWLLTVGATTLDRSFPTKITLGNKQTLFAESLFTGPEISTALAYLGSNSDDDVKGKTVLVFDNASPIAGKGVAAVIRAQKPNDLLQRCNGFACIYIDYEPGTEILRYITTTSSLS